MTAGQMNVRIDEELRIAGTDALENIGFSPSRIIRAIWTFAANNKNNPLKLEHAFAFLENNGDFDFERKKHLELVREGSQIMERARAELEVPASNMSSLPYEKLKERAYREHWKEKGYL